MSSYGISTHLKEPEVFCHASSILITNFTLSQLMSRHAARRSQYHRRKPRLRRSFTQVVPLPTIPPQSFSIHHHPRLLCSLWSSKTRKTCQALLVNSTRSHSTKTRSDTILTRTVEGTERLSSRLGVMRVYVHNEETGAAEREGVGSV